MTLIVMNKSNIIHFLQSSYEKSLSFSAINTSIYTLHPTISYLLYPFISPYMHTFFCLSIRHSEAILSPCHPFCSVKRLGVLDLACPTAGLLRAPEAITVLTGTMWEWRSLFGSPSGCTASYMFLPNPSSAPWSLFQNFTPLLNPTSPRECLKGISYSSCLRGNSWSWPLLQPP